MNTKLATLIVAGLASLLTACGGGGGGGDSAPAPQAQQQPVVDNTPTTITLANSDQVAGNAVNSFDALTGSTLMAMTGISSGDQTTQGVPNGALALVLREHLRWHDGQRQDPSKAQPLASSSVTQPCAGGGNSTAAGTYASVSSDTVGDTFSISFANCISNGITLNGGMSLTITGVGVNSVSYSVLFSSLRSNSSTYNTTLRGKLDLGISGIGNTVTLTVSTSDLTETEQYNGKTVTYMLSATTVTATADINTLAGTYSITETFAVTSGGNAIRGTITTLAPLTVDSNGGFTGGKLRVTGNASRVDMSFLGGGLVKLDVDTNADGLIENSKTVQLSAIQTLSL